MLSNNPRVEFEKQSVHQVLMAASRGLELASPNGADIHRRDGCAQRLLFERAILERKGLMEATFETLSQREPELYERIIRNVIEVRSYGVRV